MHSTDEIVDLILSDPETFTGFLADVGGDPEHYGLELEDLVEASPTVIGPALAQYAESLATTAPGWATVDLAAVDWAEVVRRLPDVP